MQLSFLGATGTVTGSKYLITYRSKQVLIDCGLFQGYKELRLRNWDKFPIKPRDIEAVILTHAHIDHSGYLPLLVKNGFEGKIYCTPGTYDLCSILLPDSGYLQEEEARLANRYGFSKHKPALPLYTQEDARTALKQFEIVSFEKTRQLFDEFTFSFSPAGHIIGSAFVQIRLGNTSILFTGDIGRPFDPVMKEPTTIQATDYLVIESTYGDRLHDTINPQTQIGDAINTTLKRGGSIIIPAFAVGRAQSLLYYLFQLKSAGKIPNIPIFLDSPMAINATKVLCAHRNEHRLNQEQCKKLCTVAHYVNTPDESKMLDATKTPKVIISASGMATGGRVLHHLKTYAQDPNSMILFTGYQAGGTRGARMVNGERQIKIHGEYIPVNAHIEMVSGASAHADYAEILEWLGNFTQPPRKTFITHGEPEAAESLKTKIEEKLHWRCDVPIYMHTESL